MSSREPMWFCHQCGAEMQPLMRPDPQCASCDSTFVEKMDDTASDPREFHEGADDFLGGSINPMDLFAQLFSDATPAPVRGARTPSPIRPRSRSPDATGSTGRVQFSYEGPGGRRSIVLGGGNTLGRRTEDRTGPPRLSDYLRNNAANTRPAQINGPEDNAIPGELMARYLVALLGPLGARGGAGMNPFLGLLGPGGDGLGDGRYGDYVFTQEALDQIISQIMEGSNSNRPVPATEDVVDDLPREVLEAGSPLLDKDCAVCKDQFSLQTEDPEEQVVITLPCKHPFHEGCILPWLKSSGTCPVCRHALVPQPSGNAHGTGPPDPSSSASSSDRARSPESGPSGSADSPTHDRGSSSSTSRPYSRSNTTGGPQHAPSIRERFMNAFTSHEHHDERQGEERSGMSSGSANGGNSGSSRRPSSSRRGSERRDDTPRLPGSYHG